MAVWRMVECRGGVLGDDGFDEVGALEDDAGNGGYEATP